MHGPFLTMGMFYLCTFLFSKLRAADTEVHLMKKKTVCIYIRVCACSVCISCVQFVLYVCRAEWMYTCSRVESKTLPILCGQPNDSQGVFFVSFSVLLVCFVTLNVVGCIWTWQLTPLMFTFIGADSLRNAFCKLFTCCLHKQTYICFMFTSSGGIQRAPVSIMDTRRHPAYIISAGHSVTLLSWVIVLLKWVLWVYLKHIASWVKCFPVFLFFVFWSLLLLLLFVHAGVEPPTWFFWHASPTRSKRTK